MLAVVKSKPEVGIEIMEVPKPRPKDDEALVRVEACGICGTDLHFYEWVEHARWITLPRVLGHELVGKIVEVGSRVKGLEVGQRVVTETWGGCGLCYYCRLGRFNSCQTQLRIGQHSDGGMAPYVTIPAVSIFPIPDSISTVEAAVLEPLGVALHALERCELKPGDDVAILGPGPIGLLATQLVKQSGASLIFVAGLEEDTQRLAFAEKWGGFPINISKESLRDRVINMTSGRGVDLVLEASGGEGALDTAVQITKPGGQVAIIGLGTPGKFDFNQMVHKEITLLGCWRRQPSSWYRAINLVKEGRVKIGDVVTHKLPLVKAEEGFKALINRRAIKVLLLPED
jgi:2-desacetyl-2-hydroxyethyl bacteriochlorophyllide A dehydrogenase